MRCVNKRERKFDHKKQMVVSFSSVSPVIDHEFRHNIREFKKSTTATATGTSLNKRFNEQNNGYARAL